MSKKLVSCILIVMIIAFGGCQAEKQEKVVTEESLKATEELFLYEGTSVDSKAIAVDEEGFLYTATCITKAEDVVMVDGVIEPVEQQIQVYDLEGTLVKETIVKVGTGDISLLKAEKNQLYCIVNKSEREVYGPTLYTIDTKTWEVKELYCFEKYSFLFNVSHIGDYFYVIGHLKEVPEKEYEQHPDIEEYTYHGECISRIKLEEEVLQEEIIEIDFPMDIVGTKKETLLIYHYNEEKGYGFLELNPNKETLEEVYFTGTRLPVYDFVQCENGFLFDKIEGIFYGTVDGAEAQVLKERMVSDVTYQRGFLFYMSEDGVKRMGVVNLLKQNTPVHLLMHNPFTEHEPYDNGYQVIREVLEPESYALKVLARDIDFDMYLLESNSPISYNLKEKGAFYALNEVEGVMEYLDACFPYVKELAINEEGDIWMIPVGLDIPTLFYHREYCEMEQVDLSNMDYLEFLNLVEKVESTATEQGSISTLLLVEDLFSQYLSMYDTFDTELFRNYATQLRNIEENVGRFGKQQSRILVVNDTKLFGIDITYTQEQLDQIPYFFYEYDSNVTQLDSYTERLGSSDIIGITGMPRINKQIGNVGTITFLTVNPNSINLDSTLAYISDFCKYMLIQKDTFLLADESTYTDIPFIKGVYEVYKEGVLFFRMDSEVYADAFWDYLEGTMELEEMIEEIERKKEIYLGE